jgi:hypothetical protein
LNRHGLVRIPVRYRPWQTGYDYFDHWRRDDTWLLTQALQADAEARGDINWDGVALNAIQTRVYRSTNCSGLDKGRSSDGFCGTRMADAPQDSPQGNLCVKPWQVC